MGVCSDNQNEERLMVRFESSLNPLNQVLLTFTVIIRNQFPGGHYADR